ncbi:hypothetical protein ACODHD_00410 [Vagococcus fluvialis]
MYRGVVNSLFTVNLSDSRWKRTPKISNYQIANIVVHPEENRGSINVNLINKISNNFLNSNVIIDKLETEIENEMELLSYRNHIFTESSDFLKAIIFLIPIQVENKSDEKLLIFPKMYLFSDNRQIINFSYKFDNNNVKEDFLIEVDLKSFYVYSRNQNRNEEIVESQFNLSVDTAINEYLSELFELYNYQGLIQTHKNIMITEYNGKLNKKNELEKLLYSLSKAPFEIKIDRNNLINRRIIFNQTLYFANMNRTVHSAFGEIYKRMKESSINIEINMLGNYQNILDSLLLKRFTKMTIGSEIPGGRNIKKKLEENKKKNLLYTINDNSILFSNYETALELYEELRPKIIPDIKMALFDEISDLKMELSQNAIENRKNKFESTVTFVGLLVTILFSYEPIEKLTKLMDISDLTFKIYLIFNIITVGIILLIRFSDITFFYLKINKRKVILFFYLLLLFMLL